MNSPIRGNAPNKYDKQFDIEKINDMLSNDKQDPSGKVQLWQHNSDPKFPLVNPWDFVD